MRGGRVLVRPSRARAKGWASEAKGQVGASRRGQAPASWMRAGCGQAPAIEGRRRQAPGRTRAGMDAGRERGWMRAGRGQAADRHRLEPGQSANHTAILAADITAKTISVTGITDDAGEGRTRDGLRCDPARGQASMRSIGPCWMRAGAGNRGQAEGKMDAGRRGQDKREARLRERSFGPGWVGCGQARASWMRSGAGRLREGMG